MNQFQISVVAHLIAEPVRSVMLMTLSDGEAYSAGALAEAAGVTAQTASFHLAKLRDGGLISVEAAGRYRYFRLAGPHIAQLLENLASVGPAASQWQTTPSPAAKELRFARCCYDHLAGEAGVAITQAMVDRNLLEKAGDLHYYVTDAGVTWFEMQGIALPYAKEGRLRTVQACLDWTERQPHISGTVGAQLMQLFLDRQWISRQPATRALRVTSQGRKAFEQHFGLKAFALLKRALASHNK